MKVVQINATCGAGSTGKICVAVSELLSNKGIENYIFYTWGNSNHSTGIKYASNLYIKSQALVSHVFGKYGFYSKSATKRLISYLEKIKPDIVHIHNIHGHDCNIEMLFNYLKDHKNIKIYFTFHDCWLFTGYCPYFDMVDCDKWISQCFECPIRKDFSWFSDKSTFLYNKKKELLTGLNITIITPSQWLAGLVKQSFLKDYPVKVINNGIDLSVFKPTPSNFRELHGLQDKKILLGVAFDWGKRKGLDVFIELSKRLDKEYQIVLVGTNENIDKQLPSNIISIHRTQNQTELAELYSTSDIFVNPTREENFPTVNIESLACGTPIITFRTGGSPEIIDSTCGYVVEKDDIEGMVDSIKEMIKNPFSSENCIKRAKIFDKEKKFEEYVELYDNIC